MREIDRWSLGYRTRNTYHHLTLGVRIPYADDAGVSADQECSARLFPIGDNAAPAFDLEHLVEATEGADHLHRAIAQAGIIVAVESNHAIRWTLIE